MQEVLKFIFDEFRALPMGLTCRPNLFACLMRFLSQFFVKREFRFELAVNII